MIERILVKDKLEGNLKAHDILKSIIDPWTLLALSGGTSPDYLNMIVDPGDIIPGAVCVVDERYGEPFHQDSNEQFLKLAKIFQYLDEKGIDVYRTLYGKNFKETGQQYNLIISELFEKFPKRVGVMGVGENLHTAGIFPNSSAAHSPDYAVAEEVDDQHPQRITLTLKALGEFTNFVILLFGPAKQDALRILLDAGENDMQKYPAIFYRKTPAKVWLVTDINL